METDRLLKSAPEMTSSLTSSTTTTTSSESEPARTSAWEMVACQGESGDAMEYSGSVARDHLANERTFLAWVRTALALVGVGVGLLKLSSLSYTAGYLVIALGVVMLINASGRYFRVMRLLRQGKFQPNVLSILAMVGLMLLVIVVLVYLSMAGNLLRHETDDADDTMASYLRTRNDT